MSSGGVLGVPNRRVTGEFGDLHAVLAVSAVTALLGNQLIVIGSQGLWAMVLSHAEAIGNG